MVQQMRVEVQISTHNLVLMSYYFITNKLITTTILCMHACIYLACARQGLPITHLHSLSTRCGFYSKVLEQYNARNWSLDKMNDISPL